MLRFICIAIAAVSCSLAQDEKPAPTIPELETAAQASYMHGDYEASHQSLLKAWDQAQQLPREDPVRYDVLKRLATVRAAVGEFADADNFLQLAISWREQNLGPNDPKIPDDVLLSVAYAPAEELKGDFVNTTREGFRIAHDVSVYSLIAVARAAAPLMEDGGSIITMTYYGAEKVVPHYNVMAVAKAALECSVRYLASDLGKKKIRVNAISAGPIKTLAARGISGLSDMLKSHAERAPLGRNVEVKEVGSTGVFLASDASSGITGEIIYVDCGYNIMGF